MVAMSVINQMLKNIDERKRENKTADIRGFAYSQNVAGQKVSLVKMIGLIMVLIFLAVLITVVTIYKFDLLNTYQDATMVSSILIKQDKKISELNNEIVEIKQKEIETSDLLNIRAQDSLTVKNVVNEQLVLDESIAKQEAKQETKSVEQTSKVEKNIIQDLTNTEQETSIIKSSSKINLKGQSEKLFKQAQSNVDRGNVSKAKQQLSKALDANIKNHRARLLLLTILLENGSLSEMQKILDTSLNQWSNINEYRQLQARLHIEKGDNQQALSVLQQKIPSVDISIDYHALLAFVAQQLQQDKLASKHFQLMLKFNTSRADWWLGFAVSEERLGNNDLALQAYNQSIRRTGLSETVKNYARQRIKIIQAY
jgi:tetratricopeptide (TPR) repeat protein